MDAFLFFFLLVLYAVLYLKVHVMFLWTIIIMLIGAFIYMSIRYPRGREDVPFGVGEALSMLIMLLAIIFIFTLMGPDPIPIIGSSFTYDGDLDWVVGASIKDLSGIGLMVIVTILLFIVVLALLLPPYRERGKKVEIGKGGEKPKVGVSS